MDHARAVEQMHTSLPASSLHSPCVRAHQLPFTDTMFFCSLWTRTDAALVHHCHPLFLAFIPSALPLSSSILFSLALYQPFLLSGSRDVRHSSVWVVLPSPSASLLLLPPFLLSPFTEEEEEWVLLLFFSVYVAVLK